MTTLSELVDQTFAVLFGEYGFVRKPSDEKGNVTYFKGPLIIDFWWGKGEIDVLVEVALSFAKDHKVFRPYISRTFTLAELATRSDASALKPFHEMAQSWPEPVGPITTPDRANAFLKVAAEVMRKHCRQILEGDLTLLEQITVERKRA